MNIKTIPIIDHLYEIKIRIYYIFLSIIFTVIISYIYSEELIYIMSKSLNNIYSNKFIYTSITEVFNIEILLSIYISSYLSIISIIYNIFMFLYPGLYEHERNYISFYSIFFIFLIFLSNYLAYKYIIPITYKYLITYEVINENKLFHLKLTAKINEFCINYIIILGIMTIISILPLIFLLLYQFKIIDKDFMNSNRDIIYILLLVITSIITPPDIINFIIISLIIIFIYEISIYLLFLFDIYKYFIFFKNKKI